MKRRALEVSNQKTRGHIAKGERVKNRRSLNYKDKMKVSITNKKELKAARNHLYEARERVNSVINKLEKRRINPGLLLSVYKSTWCALNDLYSVMDEIEVTIGGK